MARAKRAVSQPISLPAPTGGWNARDSLTAMQPTDAPILTNWYPATTECVMRSGYTKWATGIPSQVETLMAYSQGNTSNKLFAISGGRVYDVTSGGAVGAAVLTGLSNSRWQYTNIATAGGTFLSMANGVDAPRNYNGTTWTTPTITGVTATKLNSPILYAERQFFIEEGTLKTWYLPVDSIAGAANPIDISSLATRGGYIVAHGTWTIDAGQGVNDHYVLITNRGQVIVYQGSDPSLAATWSMVGVWDIGAPVGRRSLYKYAGDMLIITQDGVVPLSGALQSSRVQPRVAITDKIQYAISAAVTAYAENFGWQIMYVPTINQLWVNVPVSTGSNQQQYVMNTITGSWCNYTGWNANCFEMYLDEPYFGGNGYVARAWNTQSDAGTNITAYGLQAFNNFNNAGTLKRFTMSRPVIRSDGIPTVFAGVNIDFSLSDTTASLTFAAPNYGTWDSAIWDASRWGGELRVLQNWQGVNGVGYYGAPIVKVAASVLDVRWVSTDLVVEGGAIL
jgi:hypothetical protein